MCRIASLFLLQRLKGSMSGDARVWSLKLVSFLLGLRTYQHPCVFTLRSLKYSNAFMYLAFLSPLRHTWSPLQSWSNINEFHQILIAWQVNDFFFFTPPPLTNQVLFIVLFLGGF
jgi:hypothetical protein